LKKKKWKSFPSSSKTIVFALDTNGEDACSNSRGYVPKTKAGVKWH